MEKMVSPKGVKANMCCASCLYYTEKVLGPGIRGIKRWCKKKNMPINSLDNRCNFYVMSEFFQQKGYKVMKGGALL